jgi:two-component system response regulator FixJ
MSEVYVIDDDEPTRRSLMALLASAGFASRAYDNAAAFLKACEGLPPGCLIADRWAQDMDGVELIRRLNERHVTCPAILVSADGDVSRAVEAMKAGAANFIVKPYLDEILLSAVRSALRAMAQVSPQVAKQHLHRKALAALTPREHDVLQGVLDGKSNKVIAYDCGISPRTVEIHRANMMLKSGARSVSELVRIALTGNYAGTPGVTRPL